MGAFSERPTFQKDDKEYVSNQVYCTIQTKSIRIRFHFWKLSMMAGREFQVDFSLSTQQKTIGLHRQILFTKRNKVKNKFVNQPTAHKLINEQVSIFHVCTHTKREKHFVVLKVVDYETAIISKIICQCQHFILLCTKETIF